MNTAQKFPENAQITIAPAPPAQESIVHIWSMLGKSTREGAIYDGLPSGLKTTLCFHANLKKRHASMKLADMEYDERRKILRAINNIANAIEPLAHTPIENFK